MREEQSPIILIIDEESSQRCLLKEILGLEFTIIESSSAIDSLELLSHQTIDLILANDVLSDMSGTSLCRILKTKKKFSETPFILMTAQEDILFIQKALEAGASNFLLKPIHPFNVLMAIYVAAKHKDSIHHLNRKIHKLKKLAERDPLTNFYNRYVLYEQGKKEISKAHRGNMPLSVIMVDIDEFKNINDALGHLIGDEILMEFSDLLASALRSIDLTARFGGEEFVILLPKTDIDQALVVAEKIRMTVANHPFQTDEGIAYITVSLGVATLTKTSRKLEDLLEDIDNALYKAKENGRNQVVMFQMES